MNRLIPHADFKPRGATFPATSGWGKCCLASVQRSQTHIQPQVARSASLHILLIVFFKSLLAATANTAFFVESEPGFVPRTMAAQIDATSQFPQRALKGF